MPDLISKILPQSVAKYVGPILGAGEVAGGIALGNPALIASGASTFSSSLANDFASNKLQLPQIPKFGGGAAPGFAPAPSLPDLPTSGGLTPDASSAFTASSPTSAGPSSGSDFSAAIQQALSQILGQGGSIGTPQGDVFSGQFGG